MKKRLTFVLITFIMVCILASCGAGKTTVTTVTTATTGGNITPEIIKITNKAEYEVLEVYGYDGVRNGKYKNDILGWEIPGIKTDIVLGRYSEIAEEEVARILREYNADLTEFKLAPLKNAVNEVNEYNFAEFAKYRETECKVAFRELEKGKFAIEFRMNFHIYPTVPENEAQRINEFRHFIIYIN